MRFMRGDFGNSFLLGDSGYANNSYMLTPLTAPSTPAERRYQRAHISTRNAVERLFGVAKRRFPSLAFGMQIDLDRVLSVIVACFILHNMAILSNDPYHQFEEIEDGQIPSNADLSQQNLNSRNNVINNFFSVN